MPPRAESPYLRRHPHVLLISIFTMLLAAGCSSNGDATTTSASAPGSTSGEFTLLIVDQCSGADLDAGGVYTAPDGGSFDTQDIGLVGFTLGSTTPVGSTAVLRFSDDRSGIERFTTTLVPEDRKIRFVFGAVRETTYRWRLTVIGPDGNKGGATTGGEFLVGVTDQQCDLESLRATSETVPTP